MPLTVAILLFLLDSMLYIYCVKETAPFSSTTGRGQLVLNQKGCIEVVQILTGKEDRI